MDGTKTEEQGMLCVPVPHLRRQIAQFSCNAATIHSRHASLINRLVIWDAGLAWIRVKICVFLPENANLLPDSRQPSFTNPKPDYESVCAPGLLEKRICLIVSAPSAQILGSTFGREGNLGWGGARHTLRRWQLKLNFKIAWSGKSPVAFSPFSRRL